MIVSLPNEPWPWSYVCLAWADIVTRLAADLDDATPGWRVMQVKEKFGGLRFGVTLPEGLTLEQRERVYALINAAELKSLIVVAPEHLRAQLRGRSLASQLERIENLPVTKTAPVEESLSVFTLQSIASRIRFLSKQLAELDPQLLDLIKQHPAGPALLAEAGVGPVVAAQLLISWSHRGRVRNEAAFASLAGIAPLEVSSGQSSRHRLNRGGDRALNRALHTVAITRMRCHPETRAYEIRRSANGRPTATSDAHSNAPLPDACTEESRRRSDSTKPLR